MNLQPVHNLELGCFKANMNSTAHSTYDRSIDPSFLFFNTKESPLGNISLLPIRAANETTSPTQLQNMCKKRKKKNKKL